MASNYPSRQTAALLCNGLWGVINECYASGTPREDMRKDIRSMFHDILVSPLFSKKNVL
jgi:hypothetical protein